MKTNTYLNSSASSRPKQFRPLVVLFAALLFATSCASPGKRTGIGAAAGAGGGAAIGGLVGGWKGAALGAAIGGATGAGVGNYLDKQAQELEEVAETKRTADGILVNLRNDLLFSTGQADLKDSARVQLSKISDVLVKYPSNRIKIAGFTDSTGAETTNQTLSERRALAVKEVLQQNGVKSDQLLYRGFGEQHPVSTNSTNAGRTKNRRVELQIDVPEGKNAG